MDFARVSQVQEGGGFRGRAVLVVVKSDALVVRRVAQVVAVQWLCGRHNEAGEGLSRVHECAHGHRGNRIGAEYRAAQLKEGKEWRRLHSPGPAPGNSRLG